MNAPVTIALDRPLAELLRMLEQGPAAPFRVQAARSRPWRSVTFAGARHMVTLLLDGDGATARAAALRRTLPEMEFALRGHLVADLAIHPSEETALAFELLTIEEG